MRYLASYILKQGHSYQILRRPAHPSFLVESPGNGFELLSRDRTAGNHSHALDRHRGPGAPHRNKRLDNKLPGYGRACLLHLVAQFGAQGSRVANRCCAVRMHFGPRGRLRSESDSQPSGARSNLLQERACRRRRPVRVTDVRTGGGIKKRCAVTDGARQNVIDREPTEKVSVVRTERIARPRGLEPEEAAA